MTIPDTVFGPFGALVLLVAAVTALGKVIQALWKEHLRADEDDRTQRDVAIAGWQAQTDATKELTASIKAAAERAPTRTRRSGP